MSMNWLRLWHDMPTDPKWRVVASRASRSIPDVIAVFSCMLVSASANASERGTLHGWCHEDVAAALGIETEAVEAIYRAMQGKVLSGDKLIGWEKRQPKREDGSAERAKAHRERKRTQTNANDQQIQTKTSDSDSESKPSLPEQEAAREEVKVQKSDLGSGRRKGEVKASLRRLAEGLGFPVDEMARKSSDAKHPNAYFAELFKNEIRTRFPQAPPTFADSVVAGEQTALQAIYQAILEA